MARRLDLLFAAESLVPPVGGAEMWALELLEALTPRHDVRAAWLDGGEPAAWRVDALPRGVEGSASGAPPPAEGYWRTKARRREALGAAVAGEIERRRPDIVVAQLHGAPTALAAAKVAGVPGVLVLPSYESLCKHAFDAGSDCAPARDCASCPASAALAPPERAAMLEARAAQDAAVAGAAAVVAVGDAVAGACREWSGRDATVAPGALRRPAVPERSARAGGHAVMSSARWSHNKGVDLVLPIAEALAPREVRVTQAGLQGRRDSLARLPNVRLADAPTTELLNGAAALLVPSLWPEPFGRVAFEALAAGVPVVASAVGGLPGFVPPEGLVEPDAPAREWARTVAGLTRPHAWPEACESARAAAARVLDGGQVERLESLLFEVAQA